MLINAKKLINLPIIEAVTMKKVAVVDNLIVSPENGAVLAFLLRKNFLSNKNRIVVLHDVREMYIDGLVTNSKDNIINPDEVIKVKSVLDQNIFLLGSRVITQNSKILGYLEDFIFDTGFSAIVTLIVKKRFSTEKRIISAERILNIQPGRIVIRDISNKVEVPKVSKVLEPVLPI